MKPEKIAAEYKYDAQSIFHIMCECLSECNYHTYRNVLENVWHSMECSDFQSDDDRMKLLLNVQKTIDVMIKNEAKIGKYNHV